MNYFKALKIITCGFYFISNISFATDGIQPTAFYASPNIPNVKTSTPDELVGIGNSIPSRNMAVFNACVAAASALPIGNASSCFAYPLSNAEPVSSTTYNGLYSSMVAPGTAHQFIRSANGTTYSNTTPNTNGAAINLGFDCPADTSLAYSGTSPSFTATCKLQHVAAIPPSAPPVQCPAGNPVDTSNGAKIQKEIDINSHGVGQVGFERTYSNANKSAGGVWYGQYQKSLQAISPQTTQWIRQTSNPYPTKASACTSGWYEVKNKITDTWVQGATVQYVNNTCQAVRNGVVVQNIPILPYGQSVEIYVKPGAVLLVREDGSIFNFGWSDGDQYRQFAGERGKLVVVTNSAPVAWRYTVSNGDTEDYDANGKLLSITASNGMKQELFYDATSGLLTRVKDSTNREIIFAYAGNQISSITVDGNKTTSYTYNAAGLIAQVTRPDNTTRIYHYEDTRFPTYLTGITDERNKRYATWAYDAQGRAISSEHAGGVEKTLLSFNADGSTTVTNALHKQTIYRFADIAGARRVVKVEGQPTASCVGANQDYTYTSQGWIASKTDWKGVQTTYQYNTVGQEISRTEAFGTTDARTITTEWHPTLYVKTKITEPGKQTTFSYDTNGRLLNQSTQAISN